MDHLLQYYASFSPEQTISKRGDVILHLASIIDINVLEVTLFSAFTLLMLFIGLNSCFNLKDIEIVTTNKLLLILTKCFMNTSTGLMHLAKKQYCFFVFNKVFVCLDQVFINLSYTIMFYVNKLT